MTRNELETCGCVYPELSQFPREPLGVWPTPLQSAPRLSQELGRRVLLKRDDVNGLGGGGNKLRKLEFILGRARTEGVETVITFGALQTNHGRQTAAAAAKLGLHCELVLTKSVPRDDDAYRSSGNIFLDQLFGAVLHVCENQDEAEEMAAALVRAAEHAGRRATVIPKGGSNAVGALGYVAAAEELDRQLQERGIREAKIVAPLGSFGTAAGLIVGAARLPWKLEFPSVSKTLDEAVPLLCGLVEETSTLLGVKTPSLDNVVLDDRTLGPGYGIPTPEVWDALRMFARTEGVILDPVYTGKAAAHLMTAADPDPEIPTVFLHTGGSPGLFAYLPEAADALREQD